MKIKATASAVLSCLLPLLLLVAGCSPSGKRLRKAERSVLWVAAGTAIEFGDLAVLDQVGLGELFIEAGRLSWEGAVPRIEELPLPTMPRRTGVTLVIRGSWPQGELDAPAVAGALADHLAGLENRARAHGLVAVGFHFDVDASADLASYASGLSALQGELAEPLYLSASIARTWLGAPALREVAKAVDFLVAFFYGQRPGEQDVDEAWDLLEVEANLRRLEELDRDYLVAVVTLGRTLLLDGQHVVEETTAFGLGELVRNPNLELGIGFSLEGVNRLVYTFTARAPTRVGTWQLHRGQAVRAVGLSGYHLEEFDRRVSALPLKHYLGNAYYRLALAGEDFSLSLENLINVRAPGAAIAAPQVRLEELGGSRGRRLVRVILENANDERTDVLPLGRYNYVEIRVEGASIGRRIEPGDFHRYDILAPNARGELERAFRNVPIVHLYAPILEGHERLASGPVEILLESAEPRIFLGGKFVVPGGGFAEVVPAPEEEEGEGEGGPGAGGGSGES